MNNSLAFYAIEDGGGIYPLIIPTNTGTGLMNPSVANVNGELMCILRHVNYTFYHSEEKVFQHPWGPLTYIHPEDDMHLRTENYLLKLDSNLSITKHYKIFTQDFDTYAPLWEFIGLEDARLVCWDSKLYGCGVRRDTTVNGEGRMEISELTFVTHDTLKETARYRVPLPNNEDSYCEKNWMPVQDRPFEFVKWAHPLELVHYDKSSDTTNVKKLGEEISKNVEMRGGSQVMPWAGGYIALTHEVVFLQSLVGRKDAVYLHRFITWDSDWNITNISDTFSIMDAHIEFAAGMCKYDDDYSLISFGFQDNAAFILKIKNSTITKVLKEHL